MAKAPTLSPLVDKTGIVKDSAWLEWFELINALTNSASLGGALLAVNNLSDVANVAASAGHLGLGILNTPTFTGLTLSGLTASLPVVTDGSHKLATTSYAALANSIGFGPASSPTLAGLTITGLNGLVNANFGTLGTVSIGTSLSYTPSLLNTIQDIRTSASPTFNALNLTGLAIDATGNIIPTTDNALDIGSSTPKRIKNLWLYGNLYFRDANSLITNDGTNLKVTTNNDLLITCGANKTAVLEDVVYNDIFFDIFPKTTGAGRPTLATFTGNISKYNFAVNDVCEIGTGELLHDWKEGTPIEIHVHWASNGTDASNRAVKWEIDYTWANPVPAGGTTAFGAATTISAEMAIPTATNVDKTHYYTSIGTFTPTGGKVGACLNMSIKRIASVGTAPSNPPWGLMVGVHYQIDTIGSRFISSK